MITLTASVKPRHRRIYAERIRLGKWIPLRIAQQATRTRRRARCLESRPISRASTLSVSNCRTKPLSFGPESDAHGDFAAAIGGAREKQIRHVDAGNQQDQSDRAEHGPQLAAGVADDLFAERHQDGGFICIRIRKLLRDGRRRRHADRRAPVRA